jgi:predicted RNase H-like HicB family nuclease
MAATVAYPLRVEPHLEEGGYLAYFPDLPGCQTWGDSYEAATRNAREALNLYLETLLANGDPLPEAAEMNSDAELGVIVRRPVAA